MKVTEIMKKRMSLSFEVFPPKMDKPIEPLYGVLEKLYTVDPDFISCTYGAGGTNAGRHMEICEKIQKSDNRTVAISHFTCIGNTREDIRREMQASLDLGIDHVLALRGDIPKGWESTRGDFRHASELIAYLRDVFGTRFTIAMAGAPEKHIEARSFDEDIAHLRMKQDAGADILMTQLCYDADGFARWVERIRAAGITVPIDAGIMPVLNKDSVIRMCLGTNGCSIPRPLAELISRHYNDTPEDFRKAGIEYTIDLTYKFMNLGINGIHFYTMNKADAVLEICEGCGFTHRK
jgi:methylenetetrahydrofolate reductase (NADPH)